MGLADGRRSPGARFCIQGDYTRHVADLLTSTELEKLTRSMLARLRPLSLVQRETVIRAILEDDDRVRRRHRRIQSLEHLRLRGAARRSDVAELYV